MQQSTSKRNPGPGSKVSLLFFLLVNLVPTTLLWLEVIPYYYRFWALVILGGLMIPYAAWMGFSLREVGIRGDNLWQSLRVNLGLSLLIAAILLGLYFTGKIREPVLPQWSLFFVFYVFISSPCQEWICRGLMFAKLRSAGITRPVWLVLISAMNYAYLHVIFNDWITLVVTFGMGIVWGVIYYRVPNLAGVSVSHAFLGVTSVLVGLI